MLGRKMQVFENFEYLLLKIYGINIQPSGTTHAARNLSTASLPAAGLVDPRSREKRVIERGGR